MRKLRNKLVIKTAISLSELSVDSTSRPKGSWKWQNAYGYGVFHPNRPIAIPGTVCGKIAEKSGWHSEPARGWEHADKNSHEQARDCLVQLVEGVARGKSSPMKFGSKSVHAHVCGAVFRAREIQYDKNQSRTS